LIVLYPFITGLVAGHSFSRRSERVFRVEAVETTYRLALLLRSPSCWCAVPLQWHLAPGALAGDVFTPHSTSAMASSATSTCGI